MIREGIKELRAPAKVAPGRIRRPGGGRKRVVERDPTVLSDLEKLVEPMTRGDPESPLRWTCKSMRRLAEELSKLGHSISYPVVAELLHELGYSLQRNQEIKEGDTHPDHDAGWVSVSVDHNTAAFAVESIRRWWQSMGQPVISQGQTTADYT